MKGENKVFKHVKIQYLHTARNILPVKFNNRETHKCAKERRIEKLNVSIIK